MTGPYLLGVDIGTSSTKGVLVTLDGRVLKDVRIEHAVSRPRPGWAEMDAEAIWWGESVRVIQSLIADSGAKQADIISVAVSSIGASFVPVDGRGSPLRPGILYGIDTRAVKEMEELEKLFGVEHIRASTGRDLSTQSVGAKLQWFKKNEPHLWSKTARFESPVSFVTGRLTGRSCVDYHTALSFHPLFHIANNSWDKATCAEVLGGCERLPDIAWPQQVIGGVSKEGAAATGLRAGTSVVCGTSDVIAEALGAGVTDPGETLVMFGSTLFLVHLTSRFGAAPPMWPSYFVRPGIATVLAGTSTAGAVIQWFRERLLGGCDSATFDGLLHGAEQLSAGAGGLLALPYFSGERSPVFDPHASGMILGLSVRHSGANILRALLESIAFSFRHNVEMLESTVGRSRRYVVSGGGANIKLLTKLSSDVSGLPLSITGRRDAAPVGCAYLAGLGAKVFSDFSVLRERWSLIEEKVEPDKSVRAPYDRLFGLYLDAYRQNASAMHALSEFGD